jgi:hypothetical protein
MLLGDTVPRFRRDLKIQRKSESGGLYEVSDPVADKRFTLYDIELSIARMLDGHRTVQEVIEAGTKIGIPITLDSLEKFEKQLTAYGFLQAGSTPGNGDAWAPRDEWPPEVREMFRSALLKYRQNRFDEATDYLKAMLAIDSSNKDAQEVLKSIEVKRKEAKPAPEAAPIFAPVLEAPKPAPDAAKKPAVETKSPLTEPAASPAPAPAAASLSRPSSPAVKSLFSDLAPSPKAEPAAPAASSIPRKSSPGTKSPLTDPAPSPTAEPAAAAAPAPSAMSRKSSPGAKSLLTEPASSPSAEAAVAAPSAIPRKSSPGAAALGRMTPPSAPAVASAPSAPAPAAAPAPEAAPAAPAPSFSALVSGSTKWPPPDEAPAPAAAGDTSVTDPAANMPPATDAAPPPADVPPAEQSAAVEQSSGPAAEPLPKWAVPATGGALALALLLMVPFPRSVPASVVLEAPNAVVVKAPRDLVVKEPAVKNGTAVESGAVLLTLDGSDELGHLRPFDAKVKELQSQLDHSQRTVSKKQIASWQKTVKKIEGEIEKAKAALAKASNEKARSAAQKKIADKERELLEANAELQDATHVDAMAKLKQQLDEATAARDQAANQQAVLPSPAAGVVTDFAAAAGQHITSGAQVARIADTRELIVACSVDASEALSLAPGQKIDATLKGQSVQLLAESVAGPRVFAKIVQNQPNFIPGDTGDAKISVASKSLLGRLFR